MIKYLIHHQWEGAARTKKPGKQEYKTCLLVWHRPVACLKPPPEPCQPSFSVKIPSTIKKAK